MDYWPTEAEIVLAHQLGGDDYHVDEVAVGGVHQLEQSAQCKQFGLDAREIMESRRRSSLAGEHGALPPVGAIICALLALLSLSSALGTWALTPSGPQRGIDTPEGIAVLSAAGFALVLCVMRPFGVLSNGRWFVLAFAMGAVMICAPIWYERANDVVGLSGKERPSEFPVSENRADSALKAATGGAVAYTLVLVPYAVVGTVLASGRRRPRPEMTRDALPTSPEVRVPLPVLRPDERLVSVELVNVSGWIVASPRLARLVLTNQRVVFCPPDVPLWYTIFAWTVGWVFGGRFDDGSRRIFRAPLGQPIEVELRGVAELWENGPKYPGRVRLCLDHEGWGYRLLNPRPLGRSVATSERQHEHFESLETTWREAATNAQPD